MRLIGAKSGVLMIKISKLTKLYGNMTVINDVSITIESEKISFLMGPNGSGKTSLLKCILGLESYNGEILFDNKKIEQIYGNISVVYDDSPLYQHLSGYQNIKLLCNKAESEEAIEKVALEFLSKSDISKKVSKYSFGQKKKLSIIMAILNNSKYIFMDEASNGLDYETMHQLKNVLKNFAKTSLVFLTGHQFEFYEDIVDEVILIDKGNIVPYALKGFGEKGLGSLYEETFGFSKE